MSVDRRCQVGTTAAGYARRSTDRQEQSIGDQKKAVEAFAVEHGYHIIDWYIDDAISGAGADDRSDFQRMISDAHRKDRPFDFVLVYDVKRFGRLDNDETGYYRHILTQAGVEVVYVSEGFNGDDTDDLLRPVKQWQARQELKDLSKVVIRGQVSKSEGGWWLGGIPPYGYDLAYYDTSGRFLATVRYMCDGTKEVRKQNGELDRILAVGDSLTVSKSDRARLVLSADDRVALVQSVFSWYICEGLGYKSIADRLNKENVPSPKGGKWSMTTIHEMVTNPAYVGDMVWNRRSMAKFHRIEGKRAVAKSKYHNCAVLENDPADWIVTQNTHSAIVSRQDLAAARAKQKERCKNYRRNYRRGRGARSTYLLTGLIKCERCGHNWQGYTKQAGHKRDDGTVIKTGYYACGGYVTKGNSVCQRSLISSDLIEGMVIEEIGKGLGEFFGNGGDQLLRKMLEELVSEESPGDNGELAELRRKRADIEAKINNILDNITEANREFADKRITELKRELYDFLPRLDELEAANENHVDIDELMLAVKDYMKRFKEVAAEGTVEEKRTFIRAFTRTIELDPETGEGRAELFSLPNLAEVSHVSSRYEPPTSHSSLLMVAEEGLEPPTDGL